MIMKQRADRGNVDKRGTWPCTDRWAFSVFMWEDNAVCSRVTCMMREK